MHWPRAKWFKVDKYKGRGRWPRPFFVEERGESCTRTSTEGHRQQGKIDAVGGHAGSRAGAVSLFGGLAFGEIGGQFDFCLVGGELYDFAVATDDDLGIGSARFYDDLFAGVNERQFGEGGEGVGVATLNHGFACES